MKKRIGYLIGIVVILIGLFGFDTYMHNRSQLVGQPEATTGSKLQSHLTSKKKAKVGGKHRVLIVYFSKAGGNYPNDNLKIGHTHQLANDIAAVTGGTKYEITPVRSYPNSYDATTKRAEKEQQQNARPKIKGKLPNIRQYDTIFLGYPIWWNEIPMVVRTFMDQTELNGKTIIPFSTNAGSGWGDSLTTIKHQYPKATMKKGFEIEGQKVDSSQKQVNAWLAKLGY